MNNYISRTSRCGDCGCYGIWVDTPAGEIIENGEVAGFASPAEDIYLMVDPDGCLRCASCSGRTDIGGL